MLENTPAGTNVGTAVVATDTADADADDNNNIVYILGGTDAAYFTIEDTESDEGAQIDVKTSNTLDYETKKVYSVTITARDPEGLSSSVDVTINISDVNDSPMITRVMAGANTAPTFPAAATSREVAENTAAGENIGDPVAATDADGDTLTYTLGGTDSASFAIESATGQLKTKAALDFDTKSSYMVTVTATDPGGLTDTINVTITVTEQTLLNRYDTNDNGEIDKSEMINAITDYLYGTGTSSITKAQMIAVIQLYLYS